MHHSEDYIPDDLIAEARAERRYLNQLMRHPDPRDPDHPDHPEDDMNENTAPSRAVSQALNLIWEILNAAHYDLTKGNPADAIAAIEECIEKIEEIENP